MGLFDGIGQMFGTGAAAAKGNEDQFGQLKQKYGAALNKIDEHGGRVQGLYVENGKLKVIAVAPSEDAKNRVWDEIKAIDSNYGDLDADITVEERREEQQQSSGETYTVKPGDSLWRIAQNKLGNGNRYMEIFYANRDKLDSPQSVIHPGDELNIPQG
jgi:nucleoid-associated protein YgaU